GADGPPAARPAAPPAATPRPARTAPALPRSQASVTERSQVAALSAPDTPAESRSGRRAGRDPSPERGAAAPRRAVRRASEYTLVVEAGDVLALDFERSRL